jgi:hypothetical protein
MVVSGVFGILIAFAALLVWQQFHRTYETTQREASELATIYWHAEGFPESERQHVQQLARSYAQVVIEEEWPLMGQGQESSQAWAIVEELRRSVDGLEPSTSREQALYAQEVTLVDDLMNDRRLRLLESREGLPPILWVILLSGIPVLVGFSYFFEMKNFRAHLMMVAMLTALMVGILYSVKAIEYPFSGDVRVPPTAFELVLNRFQADANS